MSRLDYCNSKLAVFPVLLLHRYSVHKTQQRDWLLCSDSQTSWPMPISRVLCDPHWLSVQYRITYKLSLPMHLIHNN